MDASFRAELRELNEQNFQRFDAKLEQRIADVNARLDQRIGDLKAELIKWMFLFWLGTVATMLGFGRFLLTG
jgi:hypothetical protein